MFVNDPFASFLEGGSFWEGGWSFEEGFVLGFSFGREVLLVGVVLVPFAICSLTLLVD
jgi:hypothetical protein